MKILMKCVHCATINEAQSDQLDAYIRAIVKAYVTPSIN